MSLLRQAVRDGSFSLDMKADDLESIIHQAVNLVVVRGILAPEHRDEIERMLNGAGARCVYGDWTNHVRTTRLF